MAADKPAIIGTAVMAWEDAFRVIAAMPFVVGIGFAVLVAMSLIGLWIIPDPYAFATSGWGPLVGIVSGALQAALLAPLAIVVHRYVLLGETAARYPFDPASARYVRFAGFAVLVKVLLGIPGAIESMLPHVETDPGPAVFLGLLCLALFVICVTVAVRRVILFPAIATDAPGATWSNARRDTIGSSWHVAFVLVCTAVPPAAFGLVLWFILTQQGGASTGGWVVFSLVGAVVEIPTLCAFAAAAAHIFRVRADSLTRPMP